MTLRDDLVPVIDESRQLVAELGLRAYSVVVRTRTWSGGEPGLGTATDEDLVLAPTPKVSEPGPRLVAAAPGIVEEGDRYVSRISRTYTEEELVGGALAAHQELLWVIDGEPHRVVGRPEKRSFEWKVHLRSLVG